MIQPHAHRQLRAEARRPPMEPSAARLRAAVAWSRVVRTMRWLLPGLGLMLFAALLGWPLLQPPPPAPPADLARNQMEAPEFFSLDDELQPLRVSADRAAQVDDQQQQFDLARPRASMVTRAMETVGLDALRGHFDRAAERLTLAGGVSLTTSDGLVLRVDRAEMDTARRYVWSVAPTEAEGPLGQLTAAGFQVHDEGQRIVFIGPARLVLNPDALAQHRASGDAPPAKATP